MREDTSNLDRPETFSTIAETFESVEQPVGAFRKIWNNTAVRKALLLIVLASAWELFARWKDDSNLIPTFFETVMAFGRSIG